MKLVRHGLLPALAVIALSGCVVAQPGYPGPAVAGGPYGYGGGPYGYDALPPNYYDQLYPFGIWQTVPGYGPVWCPQVASAWSPYVYGPGPAWGFTFYFGDWISTPYGWGWVPGRSYHEDWRRWPGRGREHRWWHDRDRDHHDWNPDQPYHHDRGRDSQGRSRFVTPTPPRRTWSPGVAPSDRTPRFRTRTPSRQAPVERPADRGSRGGERGGTRIGPGFRSPGAPIAGRRADPPPRRSLHEGAPRSTPRASGRPEVRDAGRRSAPSGHHANRGRW
jgi:hypothetical protein